MRAYRILHVNSMLTGGGTDDRSVRIAHALHQLGHQVWMAGPAGREFSRIVQNLAVPFVPLSPGFLKLPLILTLERFIRRNRIQVVHARHGRDYWPTICAARLSRARPKVVLSRHLAKSPGGFSRRFLVSQVDAIAAVSNFVAHVLKEGHADPSSANPERHSRPPMSGDKSKIHVVYGGLDMERFVPRSGDAKRAEWGFGAGHYVFVVAGAYELPRGKGQREFLEAASRVSQELPQARFLVLGRGNMRPVLESDIKRLGLDSVAVLAPYCHDMPAAMNAIDCLVLPQVGTEALPGVICEAHACGKPVIASDLDGIGEAFRIGGYGMLIPPADIGALAQALKTWCGHRPLSDAEALQLHERVARRFSLERAASDLTDLYAQLLEPAQAKAVSR